MIKCFQLRDEHTFYFMEYQDIRAQFVAIIYTSYDSRDANVAMVALYPDSCDGSLGNEINVKSNKVEVLLGGMKWAYFKDSKCEGRNFQSNRLPNTLWSSQKPQNPKESNDPYIDKSKVEYVLTDFEKRSYGFLKNIKITIYTESKYVLKCFELNGEERRKLDSTANYLSILYKKDIENGNKELALLIMTSCENMDRNIINLKNEKMEVWLSNDNWSYFEYFKCKGNTFRSSQLPATEWILQDFKVSDTQVIQDTKESRVKRVYTHLDPPSNPKFADIKKNIKITAYYREYILKCYELEDKAEPGSVPVYKAIIETKPQGWKDKRLLFSMDMKSCDNMDTNIMNFFFDSRFEVFTENDEWLYFEGSNEGFHYIESRTQNSIPVSRWKLQKP
ncbi:uncharacterized protein LOC128994830 [Macrosteles quadrilineatus]|uniref:uncharacterized protein LOC128994830 n=1 Tax=Macrosteles quadrilineatus TaxID=74068 RepID=UPI0023E24747|nr:uncharacterized protein LOC128994830 [Macrosteles quadrilineatus]